MIIELPVSPGKNRSGRQYRLGFFHFSNNNLAIRRKCAEALGNYPLEINTSEDVDLCLRLAHAPDWIACREPGVIIRHKARQTTASLARQMWGWGINLGKVYRRTGVRGLYLHWVDPQHNTVTFAIEWAGFPISAFVFFTEFHLMHLLAFSCLAVTLLTSWYWSIPVVFLLLNTARHYFLPIMQLKEGRFFRLRLMMVRYVADFVFASAAFWGGLRAGILFIPASIHPPSSGSER